MRPYQARCRSRAANPPGTAPGLAGVDSPPSPDSPAPQRRPAPHHRTTTENTVPDTTTQRELEIATDLFLDDTDNDTGTPF